MEGAVPGPCRALHELVEGAGPLYCSPPAQQAEACAAPGPTRAPAGLLPLVALLLLLAFPGHPLRLLPGTHGPGILALRPGGPLHAQHHGEQLLRARGAHGVLLLRCFFTGVLPLCCFFTGVLRCAIMRCAALRCYAARVSLRLPAAQHRATPRPRLRAASPPLIHACPSLCLLPPQVGGSFGALFGFLLRTVLPDSWDIQPGVYALLCATAVLGGVFRSTFSLVVIVVEGTRGG